MAKGDTWRRKLGPQSFNRQPKLDFPKWDGGPLPSPDNPEAFQKAGRRVMSFHEEQDRIKKEYLLREWWKFLGVTNSDDALYELGVRLGFTAFQAADSARGRPRKPLGPQIKMCKKVYDRINSGKSKTVRGALLYFYPELNTDQKKLRTLEKEVSDIHARYEKMGSRVYHNPEN
jgi:hypothetical protein